MTSASLILGIRMAGPQNASSQQRIGTCRSHAIWKSARGPQCRPESPLPLVEPFLFFFVLVEAGFALAEHQQLTGCWPEDLLQQLFDGPSRQEKWFVAGVDIGISRSGMELRLTAAQRDQRLILGLSEMWALLLELWRKVEKGFSSSSLERREEPTYTWE